MTKKEIVKAISEEIGLTQLKTKEIVQKTFDAIVETLVADRRIELRNFGVFEVKERAARKARNPRTGERVDVPAKFVVTFKPGKEMEERVFLLEQEAALKTAQVQAQQEPMPSQPNPIQPIAAQPNLNQPPTGYNNGSTPAAKPPVDPQATQNQAPHQPPNNGHPGNPPGR